MVGEDGPRYDVTELIWIEVHAMGAYKLSTIIALLFMKLWCKIHFYHKTTLVSHVIIAITNFLVLHHCEIRFHDVIDRTVHNYVYIMTSSYAKIPRHGKMSVLEPYFLIWFRWTQLCDKKNLTFVNCCDEILSNSSRKMLLSSSKARSITFFKTRLIKSYLNS